MFIFIIRYLGFLKFVPGLAHLFDAMLRMQTIIINPNLLEWIDEIEAEVLRWPGTRAKTHKYGGLQFDYVSKEMGHIHSNGLLDMLLSRKLKAGLMSKHARVKDHHSFKNSGWISFYINTKADKEFALTLLALAYELQSDKELITLNIN